MPSSTYGDVMPPRVRALRKAALRSMRREL